MNYFIELQRETDKGFRDYDIKVLYPQLTLNQRINSRGVDEQVKSYTMNMRRLNRTTYCHGYCIVVNGVGV
jgi:hypothetical protein